MHRMAFKLQAPAIADLDEKTGDVVAYWSTEAWDTYGESMRASGWDLSRYKSVGVILFNHGKGSGPFRDVPIAKPLDQWTDQRGLLSHYRYLLDTPGEHGEFIRVLWHLEKNGAMPGHSIFFEPLEWQDRGREGQKREQGDPMPMMPSKGRIYLRQILIEGGPVTMPVNAQAATVAVKSFLDAGLPLPYGLRDEDMLGDRPGCAQLTRALKQDGFEVQTVIFPKSKWESADDCRKWLKDHDFRSDKVDETDESFRFRQREPDEFKRLRTMCLDPGRDTPMDECRVKAVGGPLAERDLAALARDEREEDEKCALSADGAVLGPRLAGALSDIRRATARVRNPLRRRF